MTRHLILSPHPDDETLNLGGSIAKWINAGDSVYVEEFFPGDSMCNGMMVYSDTRYEEITEVGEYFGFKWGVVPIKTPVDHGHLGDLAHASSHIENMLLYHIRENPNGDVRLYFPSKSESQDHEFVFRVGEIILRMSANRRFPSLSGIYEYPPYYDVQYEGILIDITDFAGVKYAAIEMFESQVRDSGPISADGVLLCNRVLGEMAGRLPERTYERLIPRRIYA